MLSLRNLILLFWFEEDSRRALEHEGGWYALVFQLNIGITVDSSTFLGVSRSCNPHH